MTIESFVQTRVEDREAHRRSKLFRSDADPQVTVRVKELLHFLDAAPEGSKGHVASVFSIFNEELASACFCEHLRRNDLGRARILKETPKPGTSKGARLDRWLLTNWQDGAQALLQAEIKSWSAQAIGGRRLALDAPEEDCRAFRLNRWANQWDDCSSCFKDKAVAKVLLPMRMPAGLPSDIPVQPLLIYWYCIHHEGATDPLFQYPLCQNKFDVVWVFSVSAFLRALCEDTISLPMSDTVVRLSWLRKLLDQEG